MNQISDKNIKNIGILGGGQLAMMMTESAIKLGYKVFVLDPNTNCPASLVGAEQILGDFRNESEISIFLNSIGLDVVTWDIEDININAVINYCPKNVKIKPDIDFLRIIQNKWIQKGFYYKYNIPTTKIFSIDELTNLPFVLKTKYGGYDGKGVWIVDSIMEMEDIILKSDLPRDQFYIEELIEIKDEFSLILCCGKDKKNNLIIDNYPITKLIQDRGICTLTETPYTVDKKFENNVLDIADQIIKSLINEVDEEYVGVLAIEFFLTNQNKILINEISPRVHNSGHYTIEGCYTSQFENHIRAITGMKIGNCSLINDNKRIIMQNILSKGYQSIDNPTYYLNTYMTSDIFMHWYNKIPKTKDVYKINRKIGHFTYFLNKKKEQFNNGIYIVMGSYSDLNQMSDCINLLKKYNISYNIDIVSAHRSPKWLYEFSENVEQWGGKIIIAGAGGAAHLPGMIASLTNLPVIGVPIETKNLGGLDSLYSIVQMPGGVPVATVGIGNSKNAGILALRILGYNNILEIIKKENLEKVDKQRIMLKKNC